MKVHQENRRNPLVLAVFQVRTFNPEVAHIQISVVYAIVVQGFHKMSDSMNETTFQFELVDGDDFKSFPMC